MNKLTNPALAEVYETIIGYDGVLAPRGEDDGWISFIARLTTVADIKRKLTEKYGTPTEGHPLMAEVHWYLKDIEITMEKAASMNDKCGVIGKLWAFPR